MPLWAVISLLMKEGPKRTRMAKVMGRLSNRHFCLRENLQRHLTEKVKAERGRGAMDDKRNTAWFAKDMCCLATSTTIQWCGSPLAAVPCHIYRQWCIVYSGCCELPLHNLSLQWVDWWEFLGSFRWHFFLLKHEWWYTAEVGGCPTGSGLPGFQTPVLHLIPQPCLCSISLSEKWVLDIPEAFVQFLCGFSELIDVKQWEWDPTHIISTWIKEETF